MELFQGIISDLFPGVELPAPDREELEACMVEACKEMNLQPTEAFLTKTLQVCVPCSGGWLCLVRFRRECQKNIDKKCCCMSCVCGNKKYHQLYEMILVRHGLMIVGLAFSGKTSSYRVRLRCCTMEFLT